MSTKATVRALVRRTLEDTSISAPLWDDETLDDAIAGALIRYGAIVPLDVRSSVAVSSGANRIEIAGLESASWIAAVRDPAGRLIEPASPDEPFSGQGWRWWNGGIDLVRPAAAGDWTIDWRSPRLLPALDTDEMPIRSGDDAAVAAFAAANLLRRLAVEEAKRGGRGGDALLALAMRFDRQGEDLARARGRQARMVRAIGG